MNRYSLEELIELWKEEQMTIEQMIGQMLLVHQDLDRRVREVARRAPPAEERALKPAPAPARRGGRR
jgi:hypothetical protein